MQPQYEHAHFLPQYWSGQNRTSRTACAGPVNATVILVIAMSFCAGVRSEYAVDVVIPHLRALDCDIMTTIDSDGSSLLVIVLALFVNHAWLELLP